jgi:hypothetical protein
VSIAAVTVSPIIMASIMPAVAVAIMTAADIHGGRRVIARRRIHHRRRLSPESERIDIDSDVGVGEGGGTRRQRQRDNAK